MLTPAFCLTQDDLNLTVSIEAPYAKASEINIYFEDNELLFYSKPYYLRLNLPGKVVYSEDPSHVSYDFDKRQFTIIVPKANQGEVFEGLDLISQLLTPSKPKKTGPFIEVIEGEDADDNDEEIDWSIDQIPSKSIADELSISGLTMCGFNNAYPSAAVIELKAEALELFEIAESVTLPMKERKEKRIAEELSKFNEDHYIADLYDDKDIQRVVKFSTDWNQRFAEVENTSSYCNDNKIAFSTDGLRKLREIPKKSFLLDKTQTQTVLLNLVDILFAYAYNRRTNEGENNVMSPWLISRLSATLSWMETFNSVEEVAVTCIRRSLIYPLFRHFELSLAVLEDVVKILKLGRKYVLKCLLEIHEIFCLTDPYYILNDLYMTDFLIWVQTKNSSTEKLLPVAERLEKVLLTKGDIKLDLVDIESIAAMAWMAHENKDTCTVNGVSASCASVDVLSSQMGKLSCLEKSETKDSSDSDSDSCSSCTDSDESGSSNFYSIHSDSDGSSDSWDSEDSVDSNDPSSHVLRRQKE